MSSIHTVWADQYCRSLPSPLQDPSLITYSVNVVLYLFALLTIYDLYTDKWKITTRRTLAVGTSLAVLASIATTEKVSPHSILWLAFPLGSLVMSAIAVMNYMERVRWQRRTRNRDSRWETKNELER